MANNVKPTKTPIFAETEAELESDAFFEDETTEVQDAAPERIEFRLNPQMCGERLDKVIIDLSRAHFWDVTAVQALDRVIIKFRRAGAEVELIGLNDASATVVDRYAVHNDPIAVEKLMGSH